MYPVAGGTMTTCRRLHLEPGELVKQMRALAEASVCLAKFLVISAYEFHWQDLNAPAQGSNTVFASSQGRRIGVHKLNGDGSCDRYDTVCQKLALLLLYLDLLDGGQNTQFERGGRRTSLT